MLTAPIPTSCSAPICFKAEQFQATGLQGVMHAHTQFGFLTLAALDGDWEEPHERQGCECANGVSVERG